MFYRGCSNPAKNLEIDYPNDSSAVAFGNSLAVKNKG